MSLKPEEIFRFVNVRPVQKTSDSRVSRRFAAYGAASKSPLHSELEKLTGPDARLRAIELATVRLRVSDGNEKELETLVAAARKASAANKVSIAKKEAEKVLGKPLATYLGSSEARSLRDSLWDRLYAHTILPEKQPEQRAVLYEGVRAFHFLEILMSQKDDDKPMTMQEMQDVTPTIPRGVIPAAPSTEQTGEDGRYVEQALRDLNAVYTKVVAINASIRDMENNDRVFKAQELRASVEIAATEVPKTQPMTIGRISAPIVDVGRLNAGGAPTLSATTGGTQPGVSLPSEHKVVVVPKKTPWVFEEYGRKNLTPATMEVLAARKTNMLEFEVAQVVALLEKEKYDAVAGFVAKLAPEAVQAVRNTNEFEYLLKEVAVAGYNISPVLTAAFKPAPGSASARGIQPLGIGDLLVVKQELMRYTAGEVAHIENVMKSEFKTRMHSRMREVEEIIITETEQIEESEKDLQTTERFELQKETEKTIQNQMSLNAGVSVTASYGPVSVTAHADFALSQSSSESSHNASTFAKEVTERSVSRIMKRAREERTRRTLERFEEKNEHGFDNKAGSGHVIGIYRWVDKYYKARLINYGRRLMMEFIVPEPAAFYRYLQSNKTPDGITLKKPVEPMVSGRRLEPTDLTKWNYTDFIAQYNVQDADAYPAEIVRVSAAFAEAAGTENNVAYAKTSEKLSVPQGYKCYDVFGEMGYQGVKDSGYFIECFIAGQRWGSVTASGLEGIIPISVKGWMKAFHVNVVAICELKPETKQAWQIKTYAAIMTAYERALADYNEQVAAAEIQAGVQIEGRNPEFNRKIESDELKKGALRLLTNNFAKTRVSGTWRFNELFNAMYSNGQYGYPEFNIEEAMVEGKIIQFFEQAFEWHNMTYRFYTYQWGRKNNWKDVFPLTDVDPLFTDFLRAGAARIVIPVHPAYTQTILHYLSTNEIWNGGNPPTLHDPLYISIVDELKADADADLDGDLPACSPDSPHPCLADEWEVKLPTTLVYLQEDAKLPDFTV